ncbi:MAG: hypothetical protein QOH91_1878, partial [Mycobacterium sp.]|nr:hypothetical protein [Mycobacterium sp.]
MRNGSLRDIRNMAVERTTEGSMTLPSQQISAQSVTDAGKLLSRHLWPWDQAPRLR